MPEMRSDTQFGLDTALHAKARCTIVHDVGAERYTKVTMPSCKPSMGRKIGSGRLLVPFSIGSLLNRHSKDDIALCCSWEAWLATGTSDMNEVLPTMPGLKDASSTTRKPEGRLGFDGRFVRHF